MGVTGQRESGHKNHSQLGDDKGESEHVVDVRDGNTTAHGNGEQSDVTDSVLPPRQSQKPGRAPGLW